MNDNDSQKVIRVLEEIRNNQSLQIERQLEALAIQREQFAIFQRQAERAERIQDKAEKLQERSAQLVGGARKALVVVLPVIIVLVIYLSWLIFRTGH
ncbi:MAG: hypothetical protein ACJ8KA_09095 [Sulfurifustis sp.]